MTQPFTASEMREMAGFIAFRMEREFYASVDKPQYGRIVMALRQAADAMEVEQNRIQERVSEGLAQKDVEILAIRQAHEQRLGELESDLAEHKATFDLRWKADMRAIKRWQEATGRTQTWPDHADLCVWLMGQLAAMQDKGEG